jgi:tRNA(fMet)-specific endonuclease VapC
VYLLDANAVIDYLRGKGAVAANMLAIPPAEIGLPAVAAYEVWVGVLGSQNAARRTLLFEQLLASVRILPFDGGVSRRAAEIRHALERRGEAIGPLDTLIAATALVNRGTLVTRNVREFKRVPGLNVVNWYD